MERGVGRGLMRVLGIYERERSSVLLLLWGILGCVRKGGGRVGWSMYVSNINHSL